MVPGRLQHVQNNRRKLHTETYCSRMVQQQRNSSLPRVANSLIVNFFLGTISTYENRTSQFARTRPKLNIFGNPGNLGLLVSLYTCKSLRFQKY